MSKKKKITKGNPAAVTQPKTRGGWKPSVSLPGVSTKAPAPIRREKFSWKKTIAVAVVVIVAGAIAISSAISANPNFGQNSNPYNVPAVSQNE
jgi:hypothetical protein